MDQQHILHFAENSQKAPYKTIRLLCVLTFIGCLVYPILAFFAKWQQAHLLNPTAIEALTPAEKNSIIRGYITIEHALFMHYASFFIVITGLNMALCAYGAWLLYRLKKKGFYIYILGAWLTCIAMGCKIGFVYQFTSPYYLVLNLLIPMAFTLCYALQLNRLSK